MEEPPSLGSRMTVSYFAATLWEERVYEPGDIVKTLWLCLCSPFQIETLMD